MDPDRRRFLGAALAGVTGVIAGCTGQSDETPTTESTPTDESTPTPAGTPTQEGTPAAADLPDAVGLETLADGLDGPVDVAFVPEADLRYVATQPGELLVHDSDGLRDEPLLDLRDAVVTGYEQGLLGVALHPAFAENRRLFVRYSAPSREGTPGSFSHTFVLAEFRVDEGFATADPGTERTVMEIPQPQQNHNAGDVLFGPDGYCYVPTGDGGDAGDTGPGHVDDWYTETAGGNGQDTSETLLGGILRIDVDGDPTEPARTDPDAPAEPAGDEGYAIPDDNPLVGEEGHRDEYYAWGLRNPWRTAFDDEDYFVGDVGQSGAEEVDLVEAGGNYGWNVREGSLCFDPEAPEAPPEECPDETPADVRGGEPLLDPILEYPNGEPEPGSFSGLAIVGGHVYRGSAVPGLEGRYVFGDLEPVGRLFVGTPPENDGGEWTLDRLDLTDDAAGRLGELRSFGRDADGELYALGGGGFHRLVPAE